MTALARLRPAYLVLALLLAASTCACGATASGSNVTVLVAFSGTEAKAFGAVIKAFEKQYPGDSVTVRSSRGLTQQLDADLQDGSLPDIAALPSIGKIAQLAHMRTLKPLDGLVTAADYGPPWSGLMRPGSGRHIYAVPVKADVKSLIWYQPSVFSRLHYRVPATWQQLVTLSDTIQKAGGTPWCLAVSSTPTSGWPGTDWISDILLSKFGPQTYQEWVSGSLPWTSGPVKQSWEMWNQLIGQSADVYSGPSGALVRDVGTVYPTPARCYLQHGTLVDEGFPAGKHSLSYGSGYGFFPFPQAGASDGAIQVSADFVGMFHDTPAARDLIRFLAGTAAQRLWVRKGADGFSADSQVPASAYPTPVTRQIARLLHSAPELCFGAADAMPPDLDAAFDRSVQVYLADPASLTSTVLPALAKFGSTSRTWPSVCGKPSTTTHGTT
jgi:alpha-glucoside transport system substrate-binding protein